MKTLKKLLVASLAVCAVATASVGVTMTASAETFALESFAMKNGASVRMTAPVGIRFMSEISQEEYSKLTNPEIGTLLIPQSVLGDNTLDLDNAQALKLPATSWVKNGEEDETWVYTGVLVGEYDEETQTYVGLPEAYWNVPITAVGYVTCDEGTVYTAPQTRSIAYVASGAILETDEKEKPKGEYYDFLLNIVDTVIGTDGFAFAETSVTMTNKASYDLNEAFSETNGSEGLKATWSVNNDIATVENGVLTATSMGEVTVTATIGSYSASVNVTVMPENWLRPTGFDNEYYYVDFSSPDYASYCAKAGTSGGTQISYEDENGYVNWYSNVAWNSYLQYTLPTEITDFSDVVGFTVKYKTSSSTTVYAVFNDTSKNSGTATLSATVKDGDWSIAYIPLEKLTAGKLTAILFNTSSGPVNVLISRIGFIKNSSNTLVNESTGEYLLADGTLQYLGALTDNHGSYKTTKEISDGALKVTQGNTTWANGGATLTLTENVAFADIDKLIFRTKKSGNEMYFYPVDEANKTSYVARTAAFVTYETDADGWNVWTVDVAAMLAKTGEKDFNITGSYLKAIKFCSNVASTVMYIDSITYIKK